MAALTRSNIGRMAISGYPGHIFVCKLRYGYGHQEHLEKLEILHSWYSDLNAYLPVVFKDKKEEYNKKQYKSLDKDGKEIDQSLNDLMQDVGSRIDGGYEEYKPQFEGQTCDPSEKRFIKTLRGIKEQLDIITAESKIIEGIKSEDAQDVFG